MEFDRIDYMILEILQNDARLMNKQIAAQVGLAASSCHERVKRLWSSGVLTQSKSIIDPEKLGYDISVVVMAKISKHGQIHIDALMDRLMAVPEIQQVHLVTGQFDLIVYMIAKNMNHLKEIARTAFSDTEDISAYETSISYDSRIDFSVPLLAGQK
jgi:DNA-binding Lrp family transcriptional regulator